MIRQTELIRGHCDTVIPQRLTKSWWRP